MPVLCIVGRSVGWGAFGDRVASYTSGRVLQGLAARGPWELRIMNSELRNKTAERGETCSAKRGHRVVSPRPQSRQAALCPMRLTGRSACGLMPARQLSNHESRGTDHAEANWPNKAILHLTQRPGSGWHRLRTGAIGVGRRLPGFRAARGGGGCGGRRGRRSRWGGRRRR